jgi:tetratricopeptide (TPR) repeat protein
MGLYERAGRENSKSCYKAVAAYTLNFLNRYLKDQKEGQVFLERDPRQNVDSSVTITIESSGFEPIPPGITDFENVIFARGIKDGIDLFRNVEKKSPELQSEAAVNRLAYDMLYKFDKINEAVEIFKLNIELHPQSSNVYDSMGEAYMIRGNRQLAIQNYETSLKLDPKNSNAEQKLKQLKAND